MTESPPHGGQPGGLTGRDDPNDADLAGPSLDLLRVAFDAIGEAIVITGPDLDPPGPLIEYVNAGFSRMTGYDAGEVVGRSPRLLQGPATDRGFLGRLRTTLEAGQRFQGEAVNYRKDGSQIVVEWLITPVRDGTGRIAHWVSAQRDVTERKRAEMRQQRLVKEVNHRVNNALAAVQSMAIQTLRAGPRSDATRLAFLGRLLALARAHNLLARSYWAGAPLRSLAEAQLAAHSGGGADRTVIDGTEVWLRPGAVVALGIALHELASNAATYGAWSALDGRVRLAWSVKADERGQDWLRLRWTEERGPPVAGPPASRGFGLRLIEHGLAHEVRATTRLEFQPTGLHCEVDAPLTALVGETP